MQVPFVVHTPFPEQGGEQVFDSMSSRDKLPAAVEGSCVTSGIEFHRITRLLLPAFTAAHTLDERAREAAERDVDVFEDGEVGSWLKEAWPE